MNIYPAILTESVRTVEEQLSLLNDVADQLPAIQIDIIDGEFTDNLTVSPIDLIGIHFGQVPVDFHLMVNDPDNYVYECKQIDNVRSVIAQIERMHSQAEFITECKEFNIRPGFSLDLYTPVESIEKDSWYELAVIQLMGIEAGQQGREFRPEVMKKLKEIVEKKKELGLNQLEIIVDGGVNFETIEAISRAGAQSVAVGSVLWKSDDPAGVYERLLEIVSG